MDVWILLLGLSSLCTLNAAAVHLETKQTVEAFMIQPARLTCNYTGPNDQWFFIRWKKQLNDTHSVFLSVLRNVDPPIVTWFDEAPKAFRRRTKTEQNVTTGDHEGTQFNLVIQDMQCEDQGKYICEIYTLSGDVSNSTVLTMKAAPEQPQIYADVVQVSENDTFGIDCTAKLGIPPARLRWKYRTAGTDINLLWTDDVTQANTVEPEEDCIATGNGRATLRMTKALNGAVFRCYADSPLINPDDEMYFDETTLQLHGAETPKPETTTVACTEGSCGKAQPSSDDTSGASDVMISHLAVTLASLVLLWQAVL